MPIKTINSTTVRTFCLVDNSEQDVAVASLIAGNVSDPFAIIPPACSLNPTIHFEIFHRVHSNSMELSGAINGLHRLLVSLGQIHANWAAQLTAELEAAKPQHYYPITGSTITVNRSGENFSIDIDAMTSLFTIPEQRALVLNASFLTRASDAKIAAFIATLYASSADQNLLINQLKAKRIGAFGA
jgi:hypothetical protein